MSDIENMFSEDSKSSTSVEDTRPYKERKREKHKYYMRDYIAKAEDVYCTVCNCTYKQYRKGKHFDTQKHRTATAELAKATDRKAIENLIKRVEHLEKMMKLKH